MAQYKNVLYSASFFLFFFSLVIELYCFPSRVRLTKSDVHLVNTRQVAMESAQRPSISDSLFSEKYIAGYSYSSLVG